MSRTALVIVALSLVFAAVTGTIALTRTIHLGQAATKPPVSRSLIAKRTAQLNRFEASLRAELRKKPPAVPKIPPVPSVSPTPAAAAVSAPVFPSQRVVYRRPAPIVIHKHRPGGEHDRQDHGDGGVADD